MPASSPTLTPAPYADWKAPKSDGGVLFWPQPDRACDIAITSNQRFAASEFELAGLSLAEFRDRARAFVGHPSKAPLIVTGHQSELHHPGVWAKNIAIDALARRIGNGAMAIHLAVDTDAPKHLFLRLADQHLSITDDPRLARAKWTGLLAAPTPSHLLNLEDQARAWSSRQAAAHGFDPMLSDTLAEMRRFALEGHEGVELPAMLANAMHQLDWSLGLDYQLVLLAPMLVSRPWLAFTAHLLSDATQFSLHYNRALADYRQATQITSDTRPMPDLAILGSKIEMPFWLDSLATGQRLRLSVFETASGCRLVSPSSDDAIELVRGDPYDDATTRLAEFCRRNWLRISPRALTLTCFVRLCLADLFIHGIGGGRYDQVLDRIFVSYFRIDPPPFAVVTATLYHPAAVGRTRACVSCALMEGHRLRHALLGDEKQSLLRQIDASPRNSPTRFALFQEMHRRLEERVRTDQRIKSWELRMEQALADRDQDHHFFDRELFYAQQPRDRLKFLIDSIRSPILNSSSPVDS